MGPCIRSSLNGGSLTAGLLFLWNLFQGAG